MYIHAISVIPQTVPSKRRGMMSECPGGNCGNPSPAAPTQQPSFELRSRPSTIQIIAEKLKAITGIDLTEAI